LPDGIFTPLVTIESDQFLLHAYYYPRETMRPAPVIWESVGGDIRELLAQLAGLEQQAAAKAKPSPPAASSRWGVNAESLRAARANLAIPVAEVIQPEDLPDEHTVIDQGATRAESPSSVPASSISFEVPPFPGPPPADAIPPAPPLPGRAAREQSDLDQFCLSLRSHARLTRHVRDDGGVWYHIAFGDPPVTDLRQVEPASGTRQTSEGTVVVGAPSQEAPPTIVEIQIEPGEAFPSEPPEVSVLLSDGRQLRVFVARLFPSGWRSHFRLRDVLRALLEALTQPRAPKQLADLLEFHGRLVVHQVESACRSVAEICAEINRTYNFQHPEQIGELEPPQQGA